MLDYSVPGGGRLSTILAKNLQKSTENVVNLETVFRL
jgi:hypothetical protein